MSKATAKISQGFQSIGVTKDWRLLPVAMLQAAAQFSFQSIGVTKDWRRNAKRLGILTELVEFPINRRHQGLATRLAALHWKSAMLQFPINRRHQGLATCKFEIIPDEPNSEGFQSIGVTKDWRPKGGLSSKGLKNKFPINRRHQGLATRHRELLQRAIDAQVSNQ